MFDANMRHLPKGYKFFAKVHSVKKLCEMYKKGVRQHDLILCEMLDHETDKPNVLFHLEGGNYTFQPDFRDMEYWIVYEGSADLAGFIDEESKQIAMQMLEGEVDRKQSSCHSYKAAYGKGQEELIEQERGITICGGIPAGGMHNPLMHEALYNISKQGQKLGVVCLEESTEEALRNFAYGAGCGGNSLGKSMMALATLKCFEFDTLTSILVEEDENISCKDSSSGVPYVKVK